MKKKSKIRFKLIVILMVACMLTGFIAAYKIINISKGSLPTWIVQDASNQSKKFVAHDTIVNELQNKQELIPLELDLTEKITISDSWGSAEIFKKLQNVYLVAKGIYSLDLMNITTENIVINEDKKTITISALKPQIKAITFDEQKTIYETTQNGLLRFGEIKITLSEHQSILTKAKEKMTEKMNSSNLYEEALKSSELALINLVNSILNQYGNYNIDVQFN